MREIITFSEQERSTVAEALSFAARRRPDHYLCLRSSVDALQALGRSISQYPLVTASQKLLRRNRSLDTLVRRLCEGNRHDRLLHIPSRAVLGQGFLIVKIQMFCLISDMYSSHWRWENRSRTATDHVFTNVSVLMSEEVFASILENADTGSVLRQRAARQLALIWEWRLSRSVEDFAPVLSSLWASRRVLRPIYGAMLGASELLQVTARTHPLWFDFLKEHGHIAEACQALEEFLFDLSHEELCTVRAAMARRGRPVVSRREVSAILRKGPGPGRRDRLDPRWMYSFFTQRQTDAQFRIRSRQPGPRRTIEEMLAAFLLERGPEEAAG